MTLGNKGQFDQGFSGWFGEIENMQRKKRYHTQIK